MVAVQKVIPIVGEIAADDAGNEPLIDKFQSRATKELFIGFAGPVGCGIGLVIEATKDLLLQKGYTDVVVVKLSGFLEEAVREGIVIEPKLPFGGDASVRFKRYRRLQEIGKILRRNTENRAILAEFAMRQIAIDRKSKSGNASAAAVEAVVVPGKVAYLIDQVKRPEEVALLRAVYRNAFYLIGVTRVYEKRVAVLKHEGMAAEEAHTLMEIDRLETAVDGQRIDRTLHLADFFVRNDAALVDQRNRQISRALDLLHGNHGVTPTDVEQGMYAAYAAGLRSACLSRQVGASIANVAGEIIATGCNDVPKAGGGLYTSSSLRDMRCVYREEQHCFNDFYKGQLREEIGEEVEKYLGTLLRPSEKGNGTREPLRLNDDERAGLLASFYDRTRLKSLIEFSRSVHAEMDAIISIARHGANGLVGSTLFTTTFPCHSCARHIVAAGISRVFYIEPYEKSMAKDLHDDAIVFDSEDVAEASKSANVRFLQFEGAAPSRFHHFFGAISRKDDKGKVQKFSDPQSSKVIPEFLDNYQDFETKAIEYLSREIESIKQKEE